ncbi:MAG: hypothetical protein GY853_13805 [PVC group bacterium]|nr:hypothetical protein [PVC group bacterium]
MLIVFDGNSIYAKCKGSNNHNCKRWTKIDVDFPGIKIDFEKAALKQTAMPKKFRFEMAGKDIQHAPIVIED